MLVDFFADAGKLRNVPWCGNCRLLSTDQLLFSTGSFMSSIDLEISHSTRLDGSFLLYSIEVSTLYYRDKFH